MALRSGTGVTGPASYMSFKKIDVAASITALFPLMTTGSHCSFEARGHVYRL